MSFLATATRSLEVANADQRPVQRRPVRRVALIDVLAGSDQPTNQSREVALEDRSAKRLCLRAGAWDIALLDQHRHHVHRIHLGGELQAPLDQ